MHPRGAHPTQSRQAFTLAEVMVATVVLLIAIVGLFAAVTVGSGMLNAARKQSIALQIIRTEIEAVHLAVWPANGPPDGPMPDFVVENATTTDHPQLLSLKNVSKGFILSGTVFPVRPPPMGAPWLKKITFTVTWTESTGRTYTRTGYTYCAKNGINALYQR